MDPATGFKELSVGSQAGPAAALRLHVHSINDASARTYSKHAREFLQWAVDAGRDDEWDLDWLLAGYLDVCCYEHGAHVNVGGTTYAALLWLDPALQLPLSKRSLKGWERLGQRRERSGFSEEIWGAMTATLLQRGEFEAAVMVAVAFDTYPRIADLRALRTQDVSAALVGDSVEVALHFGVRERGEATKTGSEQGVTVDRPWVKDALMQLHHTRPRGSRVFKRFAGRQGYREFLQIWTDTAVLLGLGWIGGPHALRHSGASSDLLHKHRGLKDIQLRGRWRSYNSVRRYAKTHMIVAANARAPDTTLECGRRFHTNPAACFAAGRRP